MLLYLNLLSLALHALADGHASTNLHANDHASTNQLAGRSTIVHLFEWKWLDVAAECERFLGPHGFGGVQISPPSENLVINTKGGRPWYERYQVMSYKLTTRSGDERDFLEMTRRCNKAGVRIYADVVVNHMTGDGPQDSVGTAGSKVDFKNYDYPAVPYTQEHFHHPYCSIDNYDNPEQVRSCNLLGLKDLNHSHPYVRDILVKYLNKLISLGVAGFRVDAAKHMWPGDLKEIFGRLKNLNTEFGFEPNSRPYVYQEVIYYGGNAITPSEYTAFGDVTEFRVGTNLKNVFRKQNALKWLTNWGEGWGLMPSEHAFVFIDNHDTQRSDDVLTYKEPKAYMGAVGFILAHPYGEPRVMSSYYFDDKDQGPPADANGNIASPTINKEYNTCEGGWVCEHRWRPIYSMVAFRNAVDNAPVENWWSNGDYQIAFSRGNRGFIAFNLEDTDIDRVLQTGLPAGDYCDVINGGVHNGGCTGRRVTVAADGTAHVTVPARANHTHLAIHVGRESRLG